MKNKFLLFMAIIPSFIFGQNYTFSKMTNCPQPLYAPASFTIGDNIYMVSGATAHAQVNPKGLTNSVWQYNTTTDTWIQKNDFPGVAVYGASGFAIDTFGYVVNGWDSTGSGSGPSTLWRYDASTDTWTTKASFTGSTRYACGVFTANNKAYISCGFKPYLNELYEYDPAGDSWSQKASLPGTPRENPIAFSVNNYGYVGMGATYDADNGGSYTASDFYKYDPTADSWTLLNNFPGDPIQAGYTFILNGEVYLAGGLNEGNITYSVGSSTGVTKYSPSTDTWSNWGLFPDTSIFLGASATAGGAGFMGLGATNWFQFPIVKTFWRFGPGTAPYSCDATITGVFASNAARNFQAMGNFSPDAQVLWNFDDGSTDAGTSVMHSFLHAGTFVVSLNIIDTSGANCNVTVYDTVVISNISNCTVSIGNTSIGNNYTLYANITGIAPYTYLWTSPNDTSFLETSPDPLVVLSQNVPDSFCVAITDNTGCIANACQQYEYVVDTILCATYLYIYPDGNVPGLYYVDIYHLGAMPASYSWDFGDGYYSSDSLPDHSYDYPGAYDVCLTITDSNNCSSSYCDSIFYSYKMGGGPMSHMHAVQVATPTTTTGIQDIKEQAVIAVYPNPANTELNISVAGNKADKAIIYSIDGQKVQEMEFHGLTNTIDISQLAAGMYIINIKFGGNTSEAKFIKAN